jgi:hypothetical protein
MLLTFLAAADGTPLSKRFTQTDGEIHVDQYPLVRDVSSIAVEVATTEEMHHAIQASSEAGLCLLKGNPSRPIVAESRAGLIDSLTLTDWLVLDLDFTTGFADHDTFLEAIGCGGVSYIKQISASAGVTGDAGLRSHIFIRLTQSASPALLKEWTRGLNLETEGLRSQMVLTASKRAVRWPLDTMVNDNTRLLYIATPQFVGMDDPAADRITYHERSAETLALDLSAVDAARNQAAGDTLVTELRDKDGLPRSKSKLSTLPDGTELLLNPASSVVTGAKMMNGWMRLNLPPSNSWGYYYNPEDPTYLRNFKDEPIVRLQDIAPDYWRSIIKPPPQLDIPVPGTERFVLRDNSADAYYTAIWKPKENFVELNKAQRKHLEDFLAVTNQPMPANVPEWRLEFNPTVTTVYDPKRQWINLYRPTDYLLNPTDAPAILPPIIDKVLTSICVDEPTKKYFLNWLAFLFQTRKKPKTSIIFNGVEGTGKGVLFQHILSKLFGEHHSMLTTVAALRDDFNDWAASKIIVCLDEFKVEAKDATKVPEMLRNYITEEWTDARGMRVSRRQERNYLAILIFTNLPDPMKIPASDRRFTVAPRQSKKLPMTDAEIAGIADELHSFANYLRAYKVDEQKVRTPMDTEAKEAMKIAAEGTGERILRAMTEGDLQFFTDLVDRRPPAIPDAQAARYTTLIHEWAYADGPVKVTLDDLRTVHQHLTGGSITKVRLQRNLNSGGLEWSPGTEAAEIHFKPAINLPKAFECAPPTDINQKKAAA